MISSSRPVGTYERIVREQFSREPVAEAYFMASKIGEELEHHFSSIRSEVRALGDTARIYRHDDTAICADTGVPHMAWQCLQALEKLADAIDVSHAGLLAAFTTRSMAVMNERLLADDWVDIVWIAEGMDGLANDCRKILTILDRKKISTLALPGGSDTASREVAITKMRLLHEKMGFGIGKREAMSALVDADILTASNLQQKDWAQLLSVTERTIRNFSAWKRICEFRKSLQRDAGGSLVGQEEDDDN